VTNPIIHIEGGQVLATDSPLTVRGLLLPYNEEGRTNVGRLTVERGTVSIPSDPSVIGHNLDHVPQDVVARAIGLEDTAEGVYATYRYADTDEGRAAYADATSPTGKRRRLSAEFGPVKVQGGKLVAGIAKLWGSAQVAAGAYPSAMVLAADTPEPGIVAPAAAAVDHPAVELPTLPADITITTPAGDTGLYTPEAAPAAANPEGASNVTASLAAPAAPVASVPPVLAPGAPVLGEPTVVTPRPVELQSVFASIAALRANPGDADAHQVLAALSDITIGGANALPGAGVIQPNWVGQLEQGSSYEREYITLGNLGTGITAAGKKGFRVKRGLVGAPIAGPQGIPNGGDWAGNKTEINSYAGRTETVESSLRRFAIGQDIGREFYDLSGGAEVVEAFLTLVIEDYMYWSDQWALYDLISMPTGAPVAPATYPTDYPAAVGMLIQGILAVKKRKTDGRRDTPTYAIANELAYAQLAYAAGGAEHLPAFVSLAVTTASKGTVDGTVTIVQGDMGIEDTPAVHVGSGRGIDFDEVAGGPIKVDALELARGGIDRAVHGYLQTFKKRPEAFVTIGVADTRANTTAYNLGSLIKAGAVVYRVVVAGTTAGAAPTAPAVGATVADGSATLLRLV